MKPRSLLLPLISLATLAGPLWAASDAPWVSVGPDGKLVYRTDAQGNRIPDFSNAGYHGGDKPLPTLPVKAEVSPVAGDAGAAIQAAIDKVSALPPDSNGWRGAVLIHKGRYAIAGTLHVRTGGVVLRGEGLGKDPTLLVATGAKQRSLILFAPGEVKGAQGEDEGASSEEETNTGGTTVSDSYVPVGAHSFHVANPIGFTVGQEIVVHRPSPANWIHFLGMDRIPQNRSGTVVQWRPGSKDILFDRVITSIQGNEISVDAPIVCALDKTYGGAKVYAAPRSHSLTEVGIENLAGDSEFKSATDEKHGWVFVDFADVRNAWARDIASTHFGYSCVFVRKPSKWVTVNHCACIDPISQITGGRRYSFALDGQLTLVEHCYSRHGRHDFVVHALAAGPNVFYDCVAELSYADSGPHHRWSVGILYDNLRLSGAPDARASGGELNIRNRGSSGTGHGWAGADQVAWNCKADGMNVEQPPTAQNWAIGCTTSRKAGNGYWQSPGHVVTPPSLYLAQLAERHAAAAP